MAWPYSSPISREIDDFWKETQSSWQQWQVQADIDSKMLYGMQDYYGAQFNINYRNQNQLKFNKILRVHNMVGGFQRDNRLATIVNAADNDPDMGETQDNLSTIMNWIHQNDNIYEKYSDCFDGANTTGLSLLQFWMDYREDPENGEVRAVRIPFSSFIMDSFWQEHDLSDCNRILTRKYLTRKQLDSIMPGLTKEYPSLGRAYSAKDGKFPFQSQNWLQYQMELYAYDEYWTRDYRIVEKLLDTRTGEVVRWSGNRDQFQLLKRYNPNVKLIEANVPTIKLNVLVNNHLVFEEVQPWGLDRFPFVPFLCYHYPEAQDYSYRYQGLVRAIRDAQIYVNRTRNNLFDMTQAQIQTGLWVKEDALVNPEDAFLQGPGKALFFKNTANLAADAVQINTPPIGAGWMELIGGIEKEIMDIVGPEELFAQNVGAKEMSGILMKLKMGAGLTGLRNIFDRLNVSQKLCGEVILDLVLNNFGMGKIFRILGKEPSQLLQSVIAPENQLLKMASSMVKYTCSVEEAELTSTQRQFKFLQAVQMRQIDPSVIPSDYLLKISSLQDKKDLMQQAQQTAEVQSQMQQIQAEQAMQHQQILTRSLEAKAQSDFAGAEERKARAVSDIALAKERASQAVHDRASAALDNAKALKEIDQMDQDRLLGLANFILDLQQKQKELAGDEEGDSEEKAAEVSASVENQEAQSRSSPQNI